MSASTVFKRLLQKVGLKSAEPATETPVVAQKINAAPTAAPARPVSARALTVASMQADSKATQVEAAQIKKALQFTKDMMNEYHAGRPDHVVKDAANQWREQLAKFPPSVQMAIAADSTIARNSATGSWFRHEAAAVMLEHHKILPDATAQRSVLAKAADFAKGGQPEVRDGWPVGTGSGGQVPLSKRIEQAASAPQSAPAPQAATATVAQAAPKPMKMRVSA